MTLLLVLLVLLPWSIWRQMHAHQVTREGLIKLPLIFAAIGIAGLGTKAIPTGDAAIGYFAFSLALSVFFGVWRGRKIDIWRDEDGNPISKGNRTTITLWVVLLASKFGLGTVASITDWFPARARRRDLPVPRLLVRGPEHRRRAPQPVVGAAPRRGGAGMSPRRLARSRSSSPGPRCWRPSAASAAPATCPLVLRAARRPDRRAARCPPARYADHDRSTPRG